MEFAATLDAIRNAVITGEDEAIAGAVTEALNAGLDPLRIMDEGFVAAMNEVGRLFEKGEYYVPDLLVAARAMRAGLEIVLPRFQGTRTVEGRVVIGSVKGDVHDIGKSIVAVMLESAGFEVIDLGVNVAPATFVEAVARHAPDILGLSALLTTTMPLQGETIEAIGKAGLRDRVKIIVGGAPVSEAWAHSVGADGYAPDAVKAVRLAKSLTGQGER